jgi:type I restriction enzyme S subunit
MTSPRKQTIAGSLPKNWDARLIKMCSQVVRGASPRPAGDPRYFDGHHLPWITVADVTRAPGMYLEGTKSKLTEEGARYTRVIPPQTLIMTNSGATLGVPKITREISGANDGIAMFLNLDGVGNEFLYYCLESKTNYFRDELAPGVGQPNLNTDLIGDVAIPIPPADEQLRIVEVLSRWDSTIETSEKLIAAKEQHLIHLRDHHLRKPLRASRLKLHSITRELTARNGDRLGREAIMAVTKQVGMRPMREETIAANIERYKLVPPKGFAYNPMRLNIGSIAMSQFDADVLVSPDYVVFECDKSRLLPGYLNHIRHSRHWKSHFETAGNGSVRVRIYYDDLGTFSFEAPPVEVQAAIVRLLDTAALELSTQKRGLMQKLLTGQWRLPLSHAAQERLSA